MNILPSLLPLVCATCIGVQGGRKTVLIVDDDPDLRAFLAQSLSWEYSVETAGDGDAGIAAARRMRPDMILCDYNMPGRNGLSALAAIRRDPALAHTAVVLMSGQTQPPESAALGIHFLAKPFPLQHLFDVVHACVQDLI